MYNEILSVMVWIQVRTWALELYLKILVKISRGSKWPTWAVTTWIKRPWCFQVQNFFIFFNATGLLKNWKKQHFICSNLTLFIVPFFLFSLFFSFFLFFLFFYLFFFFLFPGGGGDGPQPPSNDAPDSILCNRRVQIKDNIDATSLTLGWEAMDEGSGVHCQFN